MTVWFAQSSNGNISDANKWGNAPTSPTAYLTFSALAAGDILQLNGMTGINVDVSFACARVSSAQEGGLGTSTGNLVISSGSITIGTSEIRTEIKPGTSFPLVISGGTVVIHGDLNAGGVFVPFGCITLSGDSTSLTVNGKVTGGSTSNGYTISKTGNGTLIVNNIGSDAIYVSASGRPIYVNGGGGTITINGNINGSGPAHGIYAVNGTTANFIINGNIYGNYGGGISVASSAGAGATLQINGNITGGAASSCTLAAVAVGAYVSATIYGNVTGGNCTAAYGLTTAQNSRPVYIYGNLIASAYASAIMAFWGALVYVQGSLYDSPTASAYYGGMRINMPNTASIHRVYDWDGNAINLPLQLPDYDVKKGMIHGEVVGTLPPASAFRRPGRFV
ncbi:hypothetical protein ACQ9LF_12800 [Anaerohalosphaeraceae bacterium U12dextr]|jgi:hypothetical protein